LVVGSDVTINKRLFTLGDVSLNGNLFVAFDTSLNSRLVVGSDITTNKRLFTIGDASFSGKLYVGSRTASSSNTTGALIVNGGVGVNGNIWFSNNGSGLVWGSNYSRIMDDADLKIMTDDNMRFYTNNNERITINTNGHVGIGTTNPTAKLEIDGQTNIKGSNVINFGSDQSKQTDAGKIGYGTFDSGSLCIVGAGTGTRTVRMWDNVVVQGGLSAGSFTTGSISGSNISVSNNGTAASFYSSANGGDVVFVGKTSGNANYCMRMDANGGNYNYIVFFSSSGTQAGKIQGTSTTVGISSGSDYRLKKNITDLTAAEYIIENLKPVSFEFKSDPGVIVEGFIAHEVQEFIPRCVDGIKDGVDASGNPYYQGVDIVPMIPYMVKMLQIQNKRISDLQAENSNIKQQFSHLKQEVSELKQLIFNK
jgi:hypothetical protein